MAVTIRLARHGSKKRPHYRIVAANTAARRDGRFIELVGTYNPLLDPPAVSLKRDRIRHWLSSGAQVTPTVSNLLARYLDGEDTVRKPAPWTPARPTAPAPAEAEAAEAAPAEAAPAEAAPAEAEAAPAEEA